MILENKIDLITFRNLNTQIDFLPTGNIYQIKNKNILINQFLGNCLDGSINNIYMRVYEGNKKYIVPLMGINSKSNFEYNNNQAIWKGEIYNIKYNLTFTLATENIWFWQIDVESSNNQVDFIYTQDISIADKNATLSNELYVSQYIDHKMLKGEFGYVANSRQNLEQNGCFPYLQQGSLDTEIIGFSTDAIQFFGKSYKFTNTPYILDFDLPNINYQYETAYIALQTKKLNLNSFNTITFYNIYKPNYNNAVSTIEFKSELQNAYKLLLQYKNLKFNKVNSPKLKNIFSSPIISKPFTLDELNYYFPKRELEEFNQNKLLSFFSNHRHIVLMDKELELERPHGHIITNLIDKENIPKNLITSTNYIYGIFNSQLVVGNTNLHKLISVQRGLLNLFKNSGQRIYIKLEQKYHLLTMPYIYEIGINYCKWYYKLENDIIIIKSYSAAYKPDIILELNSQNNLEYEYIITNQIVMGTNEFEQKIELAQIDNKIILSATEDNFISKVYKNIHYNINILSTDFTISDDRIFFENDLSYNSTLLTIKTSKTESFKIIIEGYLDNNEKFVDYDFKSEYSKFFNFYTDLSCNFKLYIPNKQIKELDKLNEIFWWYIHNALIHYAVPHGLEQSGGAAWGTRDICQGPIELFFATYNYKLVKNIIIEVFKHQFIESGEWPQWFMFDKYNLQQYDSHGDVVFWPLKVLGDYIYITGDSSILYTKVSYYNMEGHTDIEETILEHIKRCIESIKNRYLYNTNLISYGGGDWDDTLQPANEELKQKLVSSWTVALAYQVIKQLSQIIDDDYKFKLIEIAEQIKNSFNLLIKDNVIAGFVYLKNQQDIEYMLHPNDTETGIKYRLLPMTRSIISEIVDNKQAEYNFDIIKNNLTFPDGVRLMNCPAIYRGGISKIFKRAEQSANVGREISLQYVHAHIRYIEAMAKLGKSDEVWKALMVINPICIKEEVKNAITRQSNTYFSSSEGTFNTRYEFQQDFNKLYTAEIGVKGGWRIYSSGSGIYINQLISNVLGIRFNQKEMIIDPVIPHIFDNLHFDYKLDNKNVTFIYHLNNSSQISKISINKNKIKFNRISNPYRNTGVSINKDLLNKYLKDDNIVEIY